jgi:hypothetical protein
VAINLTIFPTEAQADVFLADGSIVPIAAQKESFIQIPSGSFCTIVSTVSYDEEEHMSPEERAVAFAERMVSMWVGIADKAREKALGPTATPV